MQTFCTVITPDYFPVAKALMSSIKKQSPNSLLHVLSTEKIQETPDSGIKILTPADLVNTDFFSDIEKKYAASNKDLFRWALKPVLIGYLLSKGYSKVIFVDPDVFFVRPPDFIWELLDHYQVILTPHWPDPDIVNNPESTLAVMKGGLYNAGFIAANNTSLRVMRWWAGMCHFKTEDNKELGLFVDQKYLDLLPVQFEDIHILKHRGCNLASWNIQSSKREMVDSRLMINKEFEPVFIHFTKDTIVNILNRNDALLKPYLDEYVQLLAGNGFDLLKNLDNFSPARYETAFYRLQHKIRLRTRIKRFLFKLAEKI